MRPSPSRDCPLCPRLVDFRHVQRAEHPSWFNAPVPSFGPANAALLIVGLAPGLQGANRTGRPFTGDYAGVLLYQTLIDFGFATGQFDARPDDGLQLVNCRITNAVRCLPPQNKPIGQEMLACRPFLVGELQCDHPPNAVLALGRIAHDNVLSALGARRSDHVFGHGAKHRIGDLHLFDSFHCSRYNTNTGRLTEDMFRAVFRDISAHLNGARVV